MWIRIISATIATGFFAIVFNTDKKYLGYCALGGGIGCFVYEIGILLPYSEYIAIFLAAVAFAAYAEIIARIKKTTVSTFAICALIPLVPGNGIYQTMIALVNNDMNNAIHYGQYTFACAGLLALGILLVSTFAKLIKKQHKYF